MKNLLLLSIVSITLFVAADDVTTLFAHGAFAHPGQAKHFKEAFPNPEKFKSPKFDDNQIETSWNPISNAIAYLTKLKYPSVDYAPSHAYFGYGKDIEIIKKSIESDNNPVVLFGTCRGGIAAINYLANDDSKSNKIKALVVEGTPANIIESYNDKLAQFGISVSLSEKLFNFSWPSYPKKSESTLEAIKNIKNKDLPVLIIHSQEDRNFSFTNALQLYKEFKDQNFSKVFIAPLKGIHLRSLRDDKENYLKAIHSFYKAHGLPYNSKYATENSQNYSYNITDAQKIIAQEKIALQSLIRDKQLSILSIAAMICCTYYLWKNHYKASENQE